MKNLVVIILLCFSFNNHCHAQESVNGSGGNATGINGNVSYSVGQLTYHTQSGSNGVVEQGVQLPVEIFIVGLKKTMLEISLSVFPNPTSSNLSLQIQDFKNEKLTYQLLNTEGKLLKNGEVQNSQTQIQLIDLASSIYFININQNDRTIKTFKIIKN